MCIRDRYSFLGLLTPEVDFLAVVLVLAICYFIIWTFLLSTFSNLCPMSRILLDDFSQKGISALAPLGNEGLFHTPDSLCGHMCPNPFHPQHLANILITYSLLCPSTFPTILDISPPFLLIWAATITWLHSHKFPFTPFPLLYHKSTSSFHFIIPSIIILLSALFFDFYSFFQISQKSIIIHIPFYTLSSHLPLFSRHFYF